MDLIDTHAHLESLPELEGSLEEARQAGLKAIVAVGSDYESNLHVLDIAARYPGIVFPALGLHPWDLGKAGVSEVEQDLKLIEDHRDMIVAIGEVGLDYDKRVRAAAEKDRQQAVLKEFLALAAKLDKPVSLHSRYSWKDCFDLARAAGLRKVVFHWFTGFSSVLEQILKAGYFISATPAAEYHSEHRRAIRESPLSQLLLETDSPVFYGRENRYQASPKDIVRSLGAVAQIKGVDRELVAAQTSGNARRLFGVASSQ
ncbi:MAG: TatD family hydrolase [Chloroflexi bacterium]|nr:TatD family hydrolase [Chloroflexota bacterium]